MENASKALIIAGAILLAIIIVSLGIVVVRNAQRSMQNADLDEYEVEAFNSKITKYTGTSGQTINSEQLKDLLQVVIRSNEEERRNGRNRFVTMAGIYFGTDGQTHAIKDGYGNGYFTNNNGEGKDPKEYTIPTNLSPSRKYSVQLYKGNSGLIWGIYVMNI